MSLLSSIKSLVFPDAGLCCPRCEKPLAGHDEAACERRMSRRYFFGIAAGAAVAVAGAGVMTSAINTRGADLFLSVEQFENLYIKPALAGLANSIDAHISKGFMLSRIMADKYYEQAFDAVRKNAQEDLKFLQGDRW